VSSIIEGYTITRYEYPRSRVIGDSQVRIDTHYYGGGRFLTQFFRHSRGGWVLHRAVAGLLVGRRVWSQPWTSPGTSLPIGRD